MTITKKQIMSLIIVLSLLFALPVAVFVARKGRDIRPRALQGAANFRLNPKDTATLTAGQTLPVTVSLELTSSVNLKVSGVDFVLLYDKSKLDPIGVTPSTTATTPGAAFTDVVYTTTGGSYDATFNFLRVSLVAKKTAGELKNGTIPLANVTFKALANGSAIVKFGDDKYLEISGVAQ